METNKMAVPVRHPGGSGFIFQSTSAAPTMWEQKVISKLPSGRNVGGEWGPGTSNASDPSWRDGGGGRVGGLIYLLSLFHFQNVFLRQPGHLQSMTEWLVGRRTVADGQV